MTRTWSKKIKINHIPPGGRARHAQITRLFLKVPPPRPPRTPASHTRMPMAYHHSMGVATTGTGTGTVTGMGKGMGMGMGDESR